ncbi:MAG: cytochrome c oxidase subunit II, partial [Gemmatimonadetes bacterium]
MTRRRLWLTTAALAVAGCAGPFPQSTLRPRSDFGRAIDHLFTGIFWWAVIVFVLVETLLLITLIRFRHREGRPAPKPARGNTALEIGWTLAPAVILVLVAVPTMRTILAVAGDAPPDAVKVEVIGHQWWWEYKYPNLGIVTANEMHVPVGKPVQVSITSADVIHSFWVPALAGKRDATPGHVTRVAFRADSVGEYSGQCAEFCGVSHANMGLRVLVDSDAAFERWVKT